MKLSSESDEILCNIKPIGVSELKRISACGNGIRIDTYTYIHTLTSLSLPPTIVTVPGLLQQLVVWISSVSSKLDIDMCVGGRGPPLSKNLSVMRKFR